jgi:protein O-mannosyl-transferase
MGIEPTPHAGAARSNGFEDRGSHQAPSASAGESNTRPARATPPPAPGAPRRIAVTRSVPVRLAVLALAGAAAYAGALRAGVSWDDTFLVSANPAIRTVARPWRFFTDPWTLAATGGDQLAQYRPLRTLSFALEHAVFGGNAWGFHLVSLILHALAAWLVGCLAQELFGRGRWLAATIWLLHPALSENALYLAAQGNLLCLDFSLLAILAHLRWLERGSAGRRATSVAALLAALAAYEFGAVVPVLLLLAEAVWRRPGRTFRSGLVRRHLPYWIALAAFLAARAAVAMPIPHAPWWGGSWLASLTCQLRLWVEAWRLTILPLSQRVRYLPADIPAFATTGVAIAVHLALAALVARALATGRQRVAAACVAWWYVAQAPTSNLLVANLGYMFAPRFLFLALVLPVAACAAWLDARAARRLALAAVAAGSFVAIVLVRRQVEVWQSPLSIYGAIVAANPSDFGGRFSLGRSLLLAGDRAAARELEAASSLSPASPFPHLLLGEVRARSGDLQDAHVEYATAARLGGSLLEPRVRLAEVSLLAGHARAAHDWLATIGPFDSFDPFARARIELSLARLELALGDRSRAAARVERALAAWPYTSGTFFEGGVLLSYCGQRERGRELLATAAEQAGRDYFDMVGTAAWYGLAPLQPLLPLTPPGRFASVCIPVVGP